jgi:hypothetical protein
MKKRLKERQASKLIRRAIREGLGVVDAAEEVLEGWHHKEIRALKGISLNPKHPFGPQIVGAMSERRPRRVSPQRWDDLKEEVLDREEVARALWLRCSE